MNKIADGFGFALRKSAGLRFQNFVFIQTQLNDLLVQRPSPNSQCIGRVIHAPIIGLDRARDQSAFKGSYRAAQIVWHVIQVFILLQ